MKVAVIGTGAWGTALAQVLADNAHQPLMYGIDEKQIEDINKRHQNSVYFKDLTIHPKIKATNDLTKVLNHSTTIILSVPSGAIEAVIKQIEPLLTKKVTIINTAKGFSNQNERISTIINRLISPNKMFPLVSLIGPSHAEEVIKRRLTVITATSTSKSQSQKAAKLFANNYFRVYRQKDETGAELGASMKNVIAIASGIIEGLNLGDNARAALVTRGLYEMSLFGTHFGGKMKTYLGLTGLGDLIVTCYSFHSRNFQAGLAIGKANSAMQFLKENTKTVEGIRASKTIHELAKAHHLTLPITAAIYHVLYEGAIPSNMIEQLMARPLKEE